MLDFSCAFSFIFYNIYQQILIESLIVGSKHDVYRTAGTIAYILELFQQVPPFCVKKEILHKHPAHKHLAPSLK